MTYIPKWLAPHEVVPPEIFRAFDGQEPRIFSLFDDRLLVTADCLRERYGPLTVNNWQWGGDRTESGFRHPLTRTGAAWSQHKFGRALDCLFKVPAEEIRKDILKDPYHHDFEFITCLEMSIGGRPIGWLHFSTQNWNKARHGILQLRL